MSDGPTTWKWSHVPCRTCSAEIGAPCITAAGKKTSAHVHRRIDWYTAAQRWRDGAR